MPEPDLHAACLVPSPDVEEASPVHPVRVCVIDLGTNSFHTLIVDAYPNGTFTVLDRLKEMVRLGERGLRKHRLTDKAIKRSLSALRRVRLLADGWQVTEFLAFATSAIREAENGGDFIERVKQEVGIFIRPISGELEAELIYQGVRRAVDMRSPTLVVDIGGGSAEFIVCTSEEVFFRSSLKIGAARMTARFVSSDPVDKKDFRALRTHYREVLEPVLEAARAHGVSEIVGSSGTMENLAQVYVNEEGDPSRSIYLQAFDAQAFRRVTKRLMRSTEAERRATPGIDEKRVRQVVAGTVLVDVLLKDLAVERLRVSPNALREGMVDYFVEHNSNRLERLAPYGDVRRRAVYELGFRFQWEVQHVRHVTALTLQLFDACRSVHGLGHEERELLEFASLLHDIGYHISRSSHHKHSLYLIRQSDWLGFLREEIDVMANVARYHRGSMPKDKHLPYQHLSKENQRLVDQLASFLRLANGLDRSHYQNVVGLQATVDEKVLRLTVETRGDPQLEVWGARRGSDLFERTFGRPVEIKAVRRAAPAVVTES